MLLVHIAAALVAHVRQAHASNKWRRINGVPPAARGLTVSSASTLSGDHYQWSDVDAEPVSVDIDGHVSAAG
jgi:hypothetical protein